MGNQSGSHVAHVKTGDKKGAGLNGNVFVTLIDVNQKESQEFHIDVVWHDDFKQGKMDTYYFDAPGMDKIVELRIRRDKTGAGDAWLVDKIVIKSKTESKQSVFPLLRWINANSTFTVREFDSCLPQDDPHREQRTKELEKTRETYRLKQLAPGLPVQVEQMPEDENFSDSYKWEIDRRKIQRGLASKFAKWTTPTFKKLSDFEDLYSCLGVPRPAGMDNWRSDVEFGNQRLTGCNPTLLELCPKIPEHFPVTTDMVQQFLEGQTLSEAISRKKIYIVDLRYLASRKHVKDLVLCGPTALFYSRTSGELVPIAIQLQPTPSEDNPIFLPSDPEYTWLMAKMWYNLADSSHHQSVTHLGFTHLVMEGVAVTSHRQLSPSHPIFKLLAPHFLYLIAINTRALNKLVSVGGWVDNTMTIGREGMFDIVGYNYHNWSLTERGDFEKELQRRGVDDSEALPNYFYRDDGLLIWNALKKYVSTVVNGIYDSPEKLRNDTEIQAWIREINDPKDGTRVPGTPSSLSNNDELIGVLTPMLFISSVQHAASNFNQFDEYAFVPNYPARLRGTPPKDKTPLTEEAVVKCLPDVDATYDVIVVTSILSERGTNPLGYFETQYGYDETSLRALKQLQDDLKLIGDQINERNTIRRPAYNVLHPSEIPNSISI